MAMEICKIGSFSYPLQFYFLLFLSPLLQSLPGLADDSTSSSSKNETNADKHSSSRNSVGLIILLIILGFLSVVGFSVFLFKTWQRKRRDEQQARLLKLFENDEDLEVELGIRD